jgi:hypothetical protein
MSRHRAKEPKHSKHAKHRTSSLFATTAISAAVVGLLAPLAAAGADRAARTCNTDSTRPDPKGCARLQQFGLVSLGANQGLRVNIAFADPSDPGIPASCDVAATLFAADGSVLVHERGQVTPGQSHVLDFDPRLRTLVPGAGSTRALRASISASDPSDPSHPERVTPCTVLSTLEVYDGASGETRVITLPSTEALADPEPPSIPGR